MDKHKVLIVDDDKEYRAIVKQFLSDYDVVEVSSGEEALEIVKTHYFNCILIDYVLPGMQGDELIRQLKDKKIDSPIVVVTGYGNELLAVRAMKMQVSDYVTKHLVAELPATIGKVIADDLEIKEKLARLLEKTEKLQEIINSEPETNEDPYEH